MRLTRSLLCAVGMTALIATSTGAAYAADTIEYLPAVPLLDVPAIANTALEPVKSGPLSINTITWPGDISAVLAQNSGIFKAEGLDTILPKTENNFAIQVQSVIQGKSPFVRGTWGMINMASEAFKKKGIDLVPIVQETFSDGGDELVARKGINEIADLKGKTIALQLYGPHVDFLTTLLARAGLQPTDVKLVYLRETTLPTYDPKGKIVDPRSAFEADPSIDAAFVIAPDGDVLTSKNAAGGGTGADGSVKGAHKLVDSHTVGTVIADVYAVRSDWLATHRDQAQHFVHAMMLGQEAFLNLQANNKTKAIEWDQLMTSAATLLYDSAQAKGDLSDSISGANYVGFQGNVQFFTGSGTTRNFDTMMKEVQTSFIKINMMHAPVTLVNPGWDYTALAAGLKNVDLTAVPKPQFDNKKVQATITRQVASQPKLAEAGLTHFEVKFKPDAIDFTGDDYTASFQRVLETAQTFNNAIVAIEGYSDVYNLNQTADRGGSPMEIAVTKQAAKNLSLRRANALKEAFLAYCANKGFNIDESQFVTVAMGATNPLVARPAAPADGYPNMRAVFVIKDVSAESAAPVSNSK